MQPAYAIPPLTEAGVKMLAGMHVGFPIKKRRSDNPKAMWWGEITHTRFVSEQEAMIWIVCPSKRSGNPKWHRLSDIRFRTHVDDPLKIAIHRARLEAKELGIV